MKVAGRQLGTQEYNAVVVNRAWRDRIVNQHERMHWMRGILMHELERRGFLVKNVRRKGQYWEYTVDGRQWAKVADGLHISEIL